MGSALFINLTVDNAITLGNGIQESSFLSTADGIGGASGKLAVAFLTNHRCCNKLLLFAKAVFSTSIPMFMVSVENAYVALVC